MLTNIKNQGVIANDLLKILIMYISKVTPEIKKDMLLLHKQGIPLKMIALVFEVNHATVEKYLPDEAKENARDFKEPSSEKRLELLKIYAWLLVDEVECSLSVGTSAIIKCKQLLFNYLHLKEWQRFLEGALSYKKISEQDTYSDDMSEVEVKFIKDIMNFRQKHSPNGKKLIEQVLVMMHEGKILFPDPEEVSFPEKTLSIFLQQELSKTQWSYVQFNKVFFEYLKEYALQQFDRLNIKIINFAYGLGIDGYSNVDPCIEYDLSYERSQYLRSKCLKKLYRYISNFCLAPIVEQARRASETIYAKKELWKTRKEMEAVELASKALVNGFKDKMQVLINHIQGVSINKEDLYNLINMEVTEVTDVLREVLNTPLEDLDLSVRAFNCLKAARINSLRELVVYHPKYLMDQRNFGQKSLSEIEQVLHEKGLSFGMILV